MEAARQALERCGYAYERPCMLLSVDGFLTVQIPKSRPIVDIFMPTTDVDLPVEARQRVARVYQGQEWRAPAPGKSRPWHPGARAASEARAGRGPPHGRAAADP